MIKKEFTRYGPQYLQEARRIKDQIPLFPSKFQDPHEKVKVSQEDLMLRLQVYFNQMLRLSPIITNLFYVREFLTCGKSDAGAKNEPTHGKSVILNSSADFDEILRQEQEFNPGNSIYTDYQNQINGTMIIQGRRAGSNAYNQIEGNLSNRSQQPVSKYLFKGATGVL